MCLLLRLRATPRNAPAQLKCPGCPKVHDLLPAMHHVLGCTALRGDNATTKHHSMVAFFSGLCRQAGLPCEVEPRDFQTYKCQVCARSFKTLADHPASCRGNPLRSGPDLAISWPTGDIFHDYTTVHEMAPSNVGTAVTTLAAQKVEQKVRKYTGTTANPGPLTVDNFVPLPAYSLGGLHKNTRALLADLAAVMGVGLDPAAGASRNPLSFVPASPPRTTATSPSSSDVKRKWGRGKRERGMGSLFLFFF